MGKATKFVVLAGALAALAGAFLPLSKATEQAAAAASKAGLGGLLGSLQGSLFDIARLGGSQRFIVYGAVALLALALLFALIGVFRGYGRGLAGGSLLTAAPPAFLMAVAMTQVGSFGGAGLGLMLLLGGSGLAVLGALLALASPERARS